MASDFVISNWEQWDVYDSELGWIDLTMRMIQALSYRFVTYAHTLRSEFQSQIA